MSSPVEQIKSKLSIEEIVGSYVTLTKAGSNSKGRCPFHNEKTPSFFISPDRGTYYCFGCGAKGDIFSFIQEFEGLDFIGALKVLAERAGVELKDDTSKNRSETDKLYRIMEDATMLYEAKFALYPEARDYLMKRGLTDKTIKEFRLGFAPLDWRIAYDHLKSKGHSDVDIEKVGLTKKTEKGYYDRFRGRIMFPISDSSGRIIAFTGRIFIDDEKSAKYLNSPDTVLFSKSSVLYGLDKAKLDIKKRNYTILVEGQMDLIMSHQAGFTNTVAVSGTALADSLVGRENAVNNLGLIKRLSDNVLIAFDSDNAGLNAASRSAEIALSLGMDVKIATMMKDCDPADVILKSTEDWKDVLKGAKHVIEFHLDRVLETVPDPRKQGKALKEKVLPYVAVLESAMEKSHFVNLIRDKSKIAEEAIWSDLKDFKPHQKPVEQKPESEKKIEFIRKDSIERKLLGIIFWFKEKTDQQRYESACTRVRDIAGSRFDEMIIRYEPIKDQLLHEADVTYQKADVLEAELDELLKYLEEEFIKEELTETMMALTKAEKEKNHDKALELLKKCQVISQRLGVIRKK